MRWYIHDVKCSRFNEVVWEMVSNVDVFCAHVKLQVMGNRDGSLVVTVDHQSGRLRDAELLAEILVPKYLLGNVDGCNVLCFSCR